MRNKCIIFVHSTFSVEYAYAAAKNNGYKVFSIVTTLEAIQIKPKILSELSDYIFYGSSDPASDLAAIKEMLADNQLDVAAIVNGIDFTLYYTDFLQKHILNYPIDLVYSKIRLNKYKVNHLLKQNNIKIIPSVEIQSKDDLVNHKDEILALGWPMIAKPAEDTAGMSGVIVVNNMDELKTYLDDYLGSENAYYKDKIISKIILQEYISTNVYQEFIVDFVSYEGKHYCNAIVPYGKSTLQDNYQVFREYEPRVLSDIPGFEPIIEYIKSVLSALKVVSGFTHNEVFWDGKDSFYLVESNHRVAGNNLSEVYQKVYGFSAFTQLFNLLKDDKIVAIPTIRTGYGMTLNLYNYSTPKATVINLDEVKSVQNIIHFWHKDKLPEGFYRNYMRANHISASVLMTNDDEKQLQKDVEILLEREKAGTLFK